MNFFVFCLIAGALLVHNGVLSESGIGSSCKYDSDCNSTSAYCHQRGCKCRNEYFALDGDCIPLPTRVGDACSTNSHCSREALGKHLSECKNLTCVCKGESVPVEGKCRTKLKYQDRCTEDGGCLAGLGQSGYCSNGKCDCATEEFFDFAGGACVPSPQGSRSVRYGGECSTVNDCMGDPAHSLCYEICSCRPGYTPSTQLDQCLPYVTTYGQPCNDSQQCQIGATRACVRDPVSGVQTCRCGNDGVLKSHRDDGLSSSSSSSLGKCVTRAAAVGDKCEFDAQCYANLGQAVCRHKKCVCMEGAQESDGKCASS